MSVLQWPFPLQKSTKPAYSGSCALERISVTSGKKGYNNFAPIIRGMNRTLIG